MSKYAKVGADGCVPPARLGTGQADSTTVLHGDKAYRTPAGASDPIQGSFAPGSFTIPTGRYAIIAGRLQMTGSQRLTGEGTAQLRGI